MSQIARKFLPSVVAFKDTANVFTANQTIATTGASSTLILDAKNSTTFPARITFLNSGGTGDFIIQGDGGDVYWQSGGGRTLQMGAYHGMDMMGGRGVTTAIAFLAGAGTAYNTRVLNTTDAIAFIIRANSTQTADLTQWQNSGGTVLARMTAAGSLGLGAAPVASAKLQIDSTTQGALLPRMTAAQRQAIASPATGLQVYDTTYNEMLLYNGTTWRVLSPVPLEYNSQAAVTNTTTTYNTLSGITDTPLAGTYKAEFSCSANLNGDTDGDIALHIAAAEQVETRRKLLTNSSLGTNNNESTLSFEKMITVNGSQVVDVRFRENGGSTLTVNARTLILTPFARP